MKRHRRFRGQLASYFLLILLLGVLPRLAFAQAPKAAPAPVGAWAFEEGTGTTVADSSGKGNDGKIQGGVTWLPTGIIGAHALHFAGNGNDTATHGATAPGSATNGSVEIEKPVVDTSRSFSVAAWVRLSRIAPGSYQTFASIDGNRVSGFYLQLRGDTEQFAFSILPTDDSSNNIHFMATASFVPETGEWYHLVGVYDADAQTLSLYVDGTLQQTIPFTTPWRAGGHTAIGRGRFSGKATDYANGDIDDVRFYNVVLSASDVLGITKEGIPSPTLTIDASQPAGRVSPTLYGLMTEEISHAYDGGLYGELLQNRALRDDPATPVHWSVADHGGQGTIGLDTAQPVNAVLPVALKLTVTQASAAHAVGVANDGYWGLPIKPDTKYRASFYARAVSPKFDGTLTVSLESPSGTNVFARAEMGKPSGDWKRYEVVLQTAKGITPTEDTRFVIATQAPGTIDFNLVSLFPPTFHDRPNGNRIDLMEKMAAMKPAFLRFPGGNYLEGNTVPERFDWKRTIGPLEQRTGHKGPWGYRSTDGLGLLEFLEWCEDLHMEPVLAVYAGYSLNGDHIAAGATLQPYVQDALDEIEYVTGDSKTTWGARRAKDGHPEPFPLHYIEVGNEDHSDKSGSYDGRFAQFYDALKGQYPNLQLIATTGVKARVPDVVDEHYYKLSSEMEHMSTQYDHYSRTGPKVLVGEWASQANGKPWSAEAIAAASTPNLDAALGDAAFMTGMERNSDIVVMEAYAPLLVNINPGARNWSQNLIGYDALDCFSSPSYYAQTLFATHTGDSMIRARLAGTTGLYQSVTQDSAAGTIYVKVVNPGSAAEAVAIDVRDTKTIKAGQDAVAITLASDSPKDTNSLAQPTKIIPVTRKIPGAGAAFSYTFPPYSITVLVLGETKTTSSNALPSPATTPAPVNAASARPKR